DEEPPQTITEAVEEEGLVQEETQQESPSAEPAATAGVMPETSPEEEAAAMGPSAGKKRKQLHRKRVNDGTEANVPPKVLRKDHVFSPAQETLVSDPNPLSYAKPRPDPQQDVAEMGCDQQLPFGHPECVSRVDHIVPPGYFSELHHLPNDEFLNQYNINLARQVAIGSQLRLRYEQEVRLLRKAKAQVTGEEKIKATFEEFKKYEDGKVEQRCAEMDARLDALSIDFDEELYPHMLTAIAAFADVVTAGIAKGMSEGLEHGIEHGKAGQVLADVEAYDPEANNKLTKAL
ncbi:hypothetical protein Tco_0824826, partial [Tanacetum coccineum]